jgi:hypothetical protein
MHDGFQTEASKRMALVDGHVHIHDVFDFAAMLDHASENRDSAALRQGLSPAVPGVLMLTESQGAEGFRRAADRHGQDLAAGGFDGPVSPCPFASKPRMQRRWY